MMLKVYKSHVVLGICKISSIVPQLQGGHSKNSAYETLSNIDHINGNFQVNFIFNKEPRLLVYRRHLILGSKEWEKQLIILLPKLHTIDHAGVGDLPSST
ncbi:hypothetical protein HAX54_012418 [Datura stramonium]|uniref:Uncharacterized protein n=1 Tax=Datura stramonium TaxID=4076 RepID=A0ABS8TLN7_DATST|nr:hypothetical protein [Datura stramonium]